LRKYCLQKFCFTLDPDWAKIGTGSGYISGSGLDQSGSTTLILRMHYPICGSVFRSKKRKKNKYFSFFITKRCKAEIWIRIRNDPKLLAGWRSGSIKATGVKDHPNADSPFEFILQDPRCDCYQVLWHEGHINRLLPKRTPEGRWNWCTGTEMQRLLYQACSLPVRKGSPSTAKGHTTFLIIKDILDWITILNCES
jgi:hypothetical protein